MPPEVINRLNKIGVAYGQPSLLTFMAKTKLSYMMITKFQDWKRHLRLQKWMRRIIRRMNMISNMSTHKMNMLPNVMTWMNLWNQISNKTIRNTMENMNPIKAITRTKISICHNKQLVLVLQLLGTSCSCSTNNCLTKLSAPAITFSIYTWLSCFQCCFHHYKIKFIIIN